MKKFVLGFLAAALLFTALPIGAAVQQYTLQATAAKIVVDGTEAKDDKLPIMAYQGYNYIPAAVFRSICDKIGVGFKWDNEKKEIQINTKEVVNMDDAGNITTPTIEDTKPPVVDINGEDSADDIKPPKVGVGDDVHVP